MQEKLVEKGPLMGMLADNESLGVAAPIRTKKIIPSNSSETIDVLEPLSDKI